MFNSGHEKKLDDGDEQEEEPETNLLEMKSITVTMKVMDDYDVLKKYSSFDKHKRVIAYCIRFKNNIFRKKKNGNPLTVNEYDEAEKMIVKLIQR